MVCGCSCHSMLLLPLLYRIISVLSYITLIYSAVVQVTEEKFKSNIGAHQVALVSFSAEWCHFSQLLTPIFEAASEELSDLKGKVVLAKVECTVEENLCRTYNIHKYPTIRLFIFGYDHKHEYRGERSKASIANYVRSLANITIEEIDGQNEEMQKQSKRIIDPKSLIVGWFPDPNQPDDVESFSRAVLLNRHHCSFYKMTNVAGAKNMLAFREPNAKDFREITVLKSPDFKSILNWITNRCTPIVRELDFQNAEELTEQGLPFLIFFYHPNDRSKVSKFTAMVKQHLQSHRERVNILSADGVVFSHPLQHLGKTSDDLPILCIDSFEHMFIYPNSAEHALNNPASVIEFLEDLYSGKLHLEFHYGKRLAEQQQKPVEPDPAADSKPPKPVVPGSSPFIPKEVSSTPPRSLFRNLMPSPRRYSFRRRDEL